MHKKCRIHIHSKTYKLADADGRSCKAALDGLREANVLDDDSPKFVKEVSHSQEQISASEAEETIIEITEV